MLGGLLSRLASNFGFGGGNQGAGYGGMQTTMGQLEKPAHYGGMQTTMGDLQGGQGYGQGMPNYGHQMGFRGGMQNPQAAMMAARYNAGQAGYGGMQAGPQMNPQMNTQIGGAMGNSQGYGDLLGGQGGFADRNLSAQQMDPSVLADMQGGMGGPGMPNYASQFGANRQNAGSAMSAARYGAGQQGYQGQRPTANPFANIQSLMPGSDAGSMASSGGGMLSKLGGFAKQFKPMSSGGSSIGGMFKPGGMTNNLLGKMGKTGAAISSAPAWAIPAAGAAAFGVKHIMKRSSQKKHQKQMNAQRDQIKNAAANGQYLQGNPGNFGPAKPY